MILSSLQVKTQVKSQSTFDTFLFHQNQLNIDYLVFENGKWSICIEGNLRQLQEAVRRVEYGSRYKVGSASMVMLLCGTIEKYNNFLMCTLIQHLASYIILMHAKMAS